MKQSIPTQTTVTKSLGVNRFAPTPSGALHMGSLYLAFLDFCEAKQASRAWRLRIDDLDTPRVVQKSIPIITGCLQAHGLLWDGAIMYQSQSTALYEAALLQLVEQGLVFRCHCSRKQLIRDGHVGSHGVRYPGTCRQRVVTAKELTDCADVTLRVRVPDILIIWTDQRLGQQMENLSATVGDFVIRRRDGVYAFHLASVVDDAEIGTTHINRGMDLLGSAARQVYIQTLLGLNQPCYAHYPLILQENGQKLAKQHHSPAVDIQQPVTNLRQILTWLGYPESAITSCATVADCLALGVERWDSQRMLSEQIS